MRNSNKSGTINMTRSSVRTTHHPQLLFQADIADGYDFNRARSTESTENTLAGKDAIAASTAAAATAAAAQPSSSFFATGPPPSEGRGVPISPIKLPPTPPRDHGSPYRPPSSVSGSRGGMGVLRQPFLPTPGGRPSRPFLRPSSWRHNNGGGMNSNMNSNKNEEEDDLVHIHRSSIFRSPSSSPLSSPGIPAPLSREDDSCYAIQRSMAFDYDDDDDDEE